MRHCIPVFGWTPKGNYIIDIIRSCPICNKHPNYEWINDEFHISCEDDDHIVHIHNKNRSVAIDKWNTKYNSKQMLSFDEIREMVKNKEQIYCINTYKKVHMLILPDDLRDDTLEEYYDYTTNILCNKEIIDKIQDGVIFEWDDIESYDTDSELSQMMW